MRMPSKFGTPSSNGSQRLNLGEYDMTTGYDPSGMAVWVEEKVTRQEAEAEAFAEIAGSSSTQDEKTFAELQHDMDVDAELQRLMAEMGQTDAASATEGSAAE